MATPRLSMMAIASQSASKALLGASPNVAGERRGLTMTTSSCMQRGREGCTHLYIINGRVVVPALELLS
jgi:hypothetical protein